MHRDGVGFEKNRGVIYPGLFAEAFSVNDRQNRCIRRKKKIYTPYAGVYALRVAAQSSIIIMLGRCAAAAPRISKYSHY